MYFSRALLSFGLSISLAGALSPAMMKKGKEEVPTPDGTITLCEASDSVIWYNGVEIPDEYTLQVNDSWYCFIKDSDLYAGSAEETAKCVISDLAENRVLLMPDAVYCVTEDENGWQIQSWQAEKQETKVIETLPETAGIPGKVKNPKLRVGTEDTLVVSYGEQWKETLCTIDIASGDERIAAENQSLYPKIKACGSYLLFAPEEYTVTPCQIGLIDLENGETEILTTRGKGAIFDQGDVLYLEQQENEDTILYRYDCQEGKITDEQILEAGNWWEANDCLVCGSSSDFEHMGIYTKDGMVNVPWGSNVFQSEGKIYCIDENTVYEVRENEQEAVIAENIFPEQENETEAADRTEVVNEAEKTEVYLFVSENQDVLILKSGQGIRIEQFVQVGID